MMNRCLVSFSTLLALLFCLVSCSKDPLRTFDVSVVEDFIFSERPVAEFRGSLEGDILGARFGVVYSADKDKLKSANSLERELLDLKAYHFKADGSFAILSEDLEVDTKYYYCWFAFMGGTSFYGEVKEFSTCHPYSFQADLDLDAAVDLSSSGTANCYILSEPGLYKFRTVRGNGDESVGEVAASAILWETYGTSEVPVICDMIRSACYKDGYIVFETSEEFKEGNASVAAKDADGNILWSWHIWLTDEPQVQVYYNDAGVMMDRNLGATSTERGTSQVYGLLYQWGRKDPFLGASYVSTSCSKPAASTLYWPSAIDADVTTGRIEYATSHPTTYIEPGHSDYGYYGRIEGARWNGSDLPKSVYDPCPQGWRVPDGGNESVWAKATGVSYVSREGVREHGMDFSGVFGAGHDIWYPYAGTSYYNSLHSVDSQGHYWTASVHENGGAMQFWLCVRSDHGYSEVYADFSNSTCNVTDACSVRCVRDAN